MKIYLDKKPERSQTKYLFLVSDNWDDYGYKSLFTLSFFNGNKEKKIGSVKIINSEMSVGRVSFSDSLDRLPDHYCSLGQNKDYYLALNLLPENDRVNILTSLNDCTYNRVIYDFFKNLEQFKSSAIRFSTAEQALSFALDQFSDNGNSSIQPIHSFNFTTKLQGFGAEHKLDFDFYDQENSLIPSNIRMS